MRTTETRDTAVIFRVTVPKGVQVPPTMSDDDRRAMADFYRQMEEDDDA